MLTLNTQISAKQQSNTNLRIGACCPLCWLWTHWPVLNNNQIQNLSLFYSYEIIHTGTNIPTPWISVCQHVKMNLNRIFNMIDPLPTVSKLQWVEQASELSALRLRLTFAHERNKLLFQTFFRLPTFFFSLDRWILKSHSNLSPAELPSVLPLPLPT